MKMRVTRREAEDAASERMTYLIAETGINHHGDPDELLRLVDMAADAQFNAVKFQYFDPDTIQRSAKVREALRQCYLPRDKIMAAAAYAVSEGLEIGVTPFCPHTMLQVAFEPWDFLKVSHAESQNPHGHASHYNDRIIASMKAGRGTREYLFDHTEWLWCCPDYPTDIDSIPWHEIKNFDGFSDHTGDIRAGALAVEHGAKIVEVHITRDKSRGLDGPVSIDNPKEYVQRCREAEHKAMEAIT